MKAQFTADGRVAVTLVAGEKLAHVDGPMEFTVLATWDALAEAKIEIEPATDKTASAYALWAALTRDEVAKLDAKDSGRLQARGNDLVPDTNPVVARLASQAGVSVADWFARTGA